MSVMLSNWRKVSVMSIIGDVLAIRKPVLPDIEDIIFFKSGSQSFMLYLRVPLPFLLDWSMNAADMRVSILLA